MAYQFTPKIELATRAEYMSDRGGLFSGITQALKENTVTFHYKVADGFEMLYEWRRDYSNQPSFLRADRAQVLGSPRVISRPTVTPTTVLAEEMTTRRHGTTIASPFCDPSTARLAESSTGCL